MKKQITKKEIWIALLEIMEKEKDIKMLDFEKEAIADFLAEIGAELPIGEKKADFGAMPKVRVERSEDFIKKTIAETEELIALMTELYRAELENLKKLEDFKKDVLKKRNFEKSELTKIF